MIVLADLSTTSSKHMFLFSTAPPFYNTTSAMPIMLHLQRTATRYMCWGYTLLWGRQICPLGIPHGTGSFRDSPCSSCNVLWHVLPGEVCKSRYLSCWYLLSVLLQLVRVGVGRAPVMGCQHMQQFIHPGCDCCIGPAPGTLNQPCPKPKPLPLSNSSSRTNVHSVQCLHLLFPQVQAEITAVSTLLQRTC